MKSLVANFYYLNLMGMQLC